MGDGVGWPIEEGVFLAGVSMEVQKQKHLVLLLQSGHETLGEVDLGVELLSDIQKLTVQILAGCTGPAVAHDHSIGVQHGDYEDIGPFPQFIGLATVSQQPLDKPFQDKGAIGLGRVHPSCDDHILLVAAAEPMRTMVGDVE